MCVSECCTICAWFNRQIDFLALHHHFQFWWAIRINVFDIAKYTVFFPCRISIHCCRWDGFDLNSSIFDLIPSIFTRSDHTEWLNWMLILQSRATYLPFFFVWIPVRPTGIQQCHVLLEQQAHRTHSPNKSFNLLTHISDDLAKFVANRNLYESYRWHSRLISGWFEMMKRSVKSPAENQIHLIYISNHSRTNKNWRRTKKNRYE